MLGESTVIGAIHRPHNCTQDRRTATHSSEGRRYAIESGRLVYYASGKGSWGGSRYENEPHEADLEQTRYALNKALSDPRGPDLRLPD